MAKNPLAAALAVIAETSEVVESKAGAVIAIIRTSGIDDEKSFSEAIKESYRVNGWNATPGKPRKGSKLAYVPPTVKQCVSHIRAAFKFKLPVASYKSFHALRKALAETRAKKRPPADPRTAGVQVARTDILTGAPFHDLMVLYGNLPSRDKEKLIAAVNKLARQYQSAVEIPTVPGVLKIAA